jgi:hypothetical protein
MHEYRVVERWTDESVCVLRCNSGRFHVARILNAMPATETALQGDKPHLGFNILLCVFSGAVFRVIFESIDGVQADDGARPEGPRLLRRG